MLVNSDSISPGRTAWQITRTVWHAMFMREALARTTADRFSWFWMLAEPFAMVAVMTYIHSFIDSARHINGADYRPWIITGLLGFFLFRETLQRSMGAIQANKGLFTYRQVIPFDSVFIRCVLEGILKSLILLLFIAFSELLGIHLMPANPLIALYYWFALWCLGVGASLVLSVLSELIPDVKPVVQITMFPLLIISGVIFPLNLFAPLVAGISSLESYRPWS